MRNSFIISRELKRHANYTAEKTHVRYQSNKSNCGAKLKLIFELKEAVQEKLGKTWSPEQIVSRLYQGKLSFKNIYRWIYNGLLEVPLAIFRQKGKRPKEVRRREIFGHWELDRVVSRRGQVKGCVAYIHRA